MQSPATETFRTKDQSTTALSVGDYSPTGDFEYTSTSLGKYVIEKVEWQNGENDG